MRVYVDLGTGCRIKRASDHRKYAFKSVDEHDLGLFLKSSYAWRLRNTHLGLISVRSFFSKKIADLLVDSDFVDPLPGKPRLTVSVSYHLVDLRNWHQFLTPEIYNKLP